MKRTNEDGENASSYTRNSSGALFAAPHQSSSVFSPPYDHMQHLFPLHFASRLNSAFLVISPGSPIAPHQDIHFKYLLCPGDTTEGDSYSSDSQSHSFSPCSEAANWHHSCLSHEWHSSRLPSSQHSRSVGKEWIPTFKHHAGRWGGQKLAQREPRTSWSNEANSLQLATKVCSTLQRAELIDPYKWFFPVDASILPFDLKTPLSLPSEIMSTWCDLHRNADLQLVATTLCKTCI